MLQGVFDDRLQEHAGHKRVQGILIYVLENLQIVAAKAGYFDIQIIVDKIEFLLQSHKSVVLAQKPAENIAQLQHHHAGLVRVIANQRSDRIQRVEKKVRIDLAAERGHAGFEQQLLMLFEVHLDPRVIPNLDRHSYGHYGCQNQQEYRPPVLGVDDEKPSGRN